MTTVLPVHGSPPGGTGVHQSNCAGSDETASSWKEGRMELQAMEPVVICRATCSRWFTSTSMCPSVDGGSVLQLAWWPVGSGDTKHAWNTPKLVGFEPVIIEKINI